MPSRTLLVTAIVAEMGIQHPGPCDNVTRFCDNVTVMRIQVWAWQCEYKDCGHRWMASGIVAPGQCAKCRRRGWHKKADPAAKVEQEVTGDDCPVEMLGRVLVERTIEYDE